jgi:hypothetical protein
MRRSSLASWTTTSPPRPITHFGNSNIPASGSYRLSISRARSGFGLAARPGRRLQAQFDQCPRRCAAPSLEDRASGHRRSDGGNRCRDRVTPAPGAACASGLVVLPKPTPRPLPGEVPANARALRGGAPARRAGSFDAGPAMLGPPRAGPCYCPPNPAWREAHQLPSTMFNPNKKVDQQCRNTRDTTTRAR